MNIIVPQGQSKTLNLDLSDLGSISTTEIEKYVVVIFSITNDKRFEYPVVATEASKGRFTIPSGLKKVTEGYSLDPSAKNGTAYMPVGMYNVEIGYKGDNNEVSVVAGGKDFMKVVPSNFMVGLIPSNS